MNQFILSSLIAIGLALVGVLADVLIKKAGAGPGYMDLKYFILGIIIYALMAFGWFYVMKTLKLSTIGVFYGVSSVLFLTLAGFIFFAEHLNAFEWAGLILGITSIILLTIFA